jgi:hypothetical protein
MISDKALVRGNDARDIADMVDKLTYALNNVHVPPVQIGPMVQTIISAMILAPDHAN